jgi:tetratricopeptide (TPR) repeat protein
LGRTTRLPAELRADALNMAGLLAFARGDLEVAATLSRESVAVLRQIGDRRRLADALQGLGTVARDKCSYPEALATLEESLRISREDDDQYGIADNLFQLGLLARQQADHARAQSLLAEAFAIYRAHGHPRYMGATLLNLGLVAEDLGDYPRAQSLYEQSAPLMRQVNDRWHLAFLLEAFASLCVARGRFRRGALLSGAATTLREQIGSTVPPSMQPRVDRTLELARDGLSDDAFAQAWAAGQAMTLDEAIAYALEEDSA